MEFTAEVIELKTKKVNHNNIKYRIILETDNPNVLELAKLEPQTMIKVQTTEIENDWPAIEYNQVYL